MPIKDRSSNADEKVSTLEYSFFSRILIFLISAPGPWQLLHLHIIITQFV